MKLANAIKKLGTFAPVAEENGRYYATRNGHTISFLKNGVDGITCCHSRRNSEKDDLQSDYFAGSYFDNLTQAINFTLRQIERDEQEYRAAKQVPGTGRAQCQINRQQMAVRNLTAELKSAKMRFRRVSEIFGNEPSAENSALLQRAAIQLQNARAARDESESILREMARELTGPAYQPEEDAPADYIRANW